MKISTYTVCKLNLKICSTCQEYVYFESGNKSAKEVNLMIA